MNKENGSGTSREAPGIVIRLAPSPPVQPTVTAFIWGGKTRPVPSLPYGRRSAA